MEVILLEKIANLGDLGDRVAITSGYGRNYLIPQGKAVAATAEKIEEFEQRLAELEGIAAEKLELATARATALNELNVVITHKAGDGGKLFGSVGTQDIADAITNAGEQVEKHEIRMPDGVIRQTGVYAIDIHLHSDVLVTLSIIIDAEA